MDTENPNALTTLPTIGGLQVVVDDEPQGGVDGTDTLGREDFQLPRLVLCQSMTPQRKKTEQSYLKGLDEGMFFDNVEGTIYGEGPLYFAVVRMLGTRHIEFHSADDGGGVKDFDVKPGDPRTRFTTETRDGREVRVKPKATLFYDYLILLLSPDGRRHLITMSLKGTQIKMAKTFNSFLKTAKYGLFSIASVPDKRDDYSFFNVKIERVKLGDKPASVPASDRALLDNLRDQYQNVTAAQVIKAESLEDEERVPGADDVEELPY
jgi:hypothetical protein